MQRGMIIKGLKAIVTERENELRELDANREELIGRIQGLHAAIKEVECSTMNTVTRPQTGTYREQITDVVEQVLQIERPLHRSVILKRVKDLGVYMGPTNPMSSLGAYLSLDDRFSTVGKGVWTLTEDIIERRSPTPVESNKRHDNVTAQDLKDFKIMRKAVEEIARRNDGIVYTTAVARLLKEAGITTSKEPNIHRLFKNRDDWDKVAPGAYKWLSYVPPAVEAFPSAGVDSDQQPNLILNGETKLEEELC